MDRKLGGLIAACLVLVACSDQGHNEIKEAVRSSLKDPESARFAEELRVTKGPRSVVACGSVNAKNSFGGYVGESPFMYYQGHTVFGANAEKAAVVVRCCSFVSATVAAGNAPWDSPDWGKNCGGALPPHSFDFTVKG